jgi:hypothetical protein
MCLPLSVRRVLVDRLRNASPIFCRTLLNGANLLYPTLMTWTDTSLHVCRGTLRIPKSMGLTLNMQQRSSRQPTWRSRSYRLWSTNRHFSDMGR